MDKIDAAMEMLEAALCTPLSLQSTSNRRLVNAIIEVQHKLEKFFEHATSSGLDTDQFSRHAKIAIDKVVSALAQEFTDPESLVKFMKAAYPKTEERGVRAARSLNPSTFHALINNDIQLMHWFGLQQAILDNAAHAKESSSPRRRDPAFGGGKEKFFEKVDGLAKYQA